MRRCVSRLASVGASTTTAADVASLPFDVVVVGGGASGCLIAGRLAMENLKTLVVEEGSDIRQSPRWHSTLPASQIAHRVARRGYERSDTTTTPQRQFDGSRAPMLVPTPMVLGGHGVMGSRTWNIGDAQDWAGGPWSFREDLLPRIRLFENMEQFVPHRGKRGQFLICRPRNFSPYSKPFSEAVSHDVPLLSVFTNRDFRIGCGCGRPDTFVDQSTGLSHTTLERYLIGTAQLNRPLRVLCNSKVIGISGGGGGSRTRASGVAIRGADGEVKEVKSTIIVVCAGAIGSPRLLAASRGAIAVDDGVGENYWDIPQVVLQYRTKHRRSHNCFLDPLVRAILRVDLRLESPLLSLRSSWDDLICYWSSTGSLTPDVEILFQPFTLNNDGVQPLQAGEHGCQFVIRPLRPKSRGRISADGSIDPNYFGETSDLVALQRAVDYVKQTVVKRASLASLLGDLVKERFESSGIGGGACGAAVDPESFYVKGMENVCVCDHSILPSPLTGSTLPYTMALADRCVDKLLRRKEVKQRVEEDPAAGATRIIY